ncbi:MAG TPA: glycosyltransferase, partial [Burkholderiales bacterium]|nr:glycosyltransferase [Burkholderiales bacterium]
EPFRRYAFPLKVVEYMAAGLACIGTRNTETADLLQRYDCGIAVPFRADALAVAVRTLAQDGALRARLQHHAREAAGHFQWETLAAREYEIVRRALSARASEACHD